MPAWIAIALLDLNDARVAELIEAFRTEELGAGQSDPMPRLIANVCTELRDCITFGGATVSATANSIPASLKELAVQKVARLLKQRLLQPLSDDEKEAEKLYQKRLEKLTQGEWPVETPDNPVTVPDVPQGEGFYGGDAKLPI